MYFIVKVVLVLCQYASTLAHTHIHVLIVRSRFIQNHCVRDNLRKQSHRRSSMIRHADVLFELTDSAVYGVFYAANIVRQTFFQMSLNGGRLKGLKSSTVNTYILLLAIWILFRNVGELDTCRANHCFEAGLNWTRLNMWTYSRMSIWAKLRFGMNERLHVLSRYMYLRFFLLFLFCWILCTFRHRRHFLYL